jgi:hypothetical protein
MGRLLFGFEGITGLLLLGIWIWAILDVIATDEAMIRSLPKGVWLLLVIILPTIGAVAWIALGRPANVGWRPGDTNYKTVRRTVGPEDRADWNRSREEQRREFEEADRRLREERDRRREEMLSERDDKDIRAKQLGEWEADLLRREKEMLERRRADRPDGPGA